MENKVLIVEDEMLIALDLKRILSKADYQVCGIANSVEEAVILIAKYSPEMVLLDIHLKGTRTGIDLANVLSKKNIGFIFLSANFEKEIIEKAKSTKPYGFLIKPFRANELLVTLEVAFYRHRNSIEFKLRNEQGLESILSEISRDICDNNKKLLRTVKCLQQFVPFDFLSIAKKNNLLNGLFFSSFLRIGFEEYQKIGTAELVNIANISASEIIQLQNDADFDTKLEYKNGDDFLAKNQNNNFEEFVARTFKLQSKLNVPLLSPTKGISTFSFFSRNADCYTPEHLFLLNNVSQKIISILDTCWVDSIENEPVVVNKKNSKKNHSVKTYVKEKEIKGKSHQILNVQDLIAIVAPLDTSVLILGESGTGKERVAKSIHELSKRNKQPLVIVNCASLPANLIESELFGHEKGAFTGAIERRLGKFELADKGTIFLDEIGEMPQELQVKLLRVLQEQEIERVGGKNPIQINVRIIAATNRILEKEVEEGRFRLDLYYRLFVFPILIPPLRERKDDILELAAYFLSYFSSKNGKNFSGFSPEVVEKLMSYHWPGNVRELEHLIERSILLNSGPLLNQISLPKLFTNSTALNQEEKKIKSDEENCRDHILVVLKKCKGRISGIGGAAEILNMQSTTLRSKIKKLGIQKDDF